MSSECYFNETLIANLIIDIPNIENLKDRGEGNGVPPDFRQRSKDRSRSRSRRSKERSDPYEPMRKIECAINAVNPTANRASAIIRSIGSTYPRIPVIAFAMNRWITTVNRFPTTVSLGLTTDRNVRSTARGRPRKNRVVNNLILA